MIVFSVAITLASSRKMCSPWSPPVGAQLVAVAELHPRPQPGEGVNVRVEPAAADQVAARRRDDHLVEPGEQRAGEQERGAHPPAQLGIELVLGDLGGADTHLVGAGPGDVGAEVREQLQHRLDVPDPRHVRERNRLLGEEGRGQDRQRPVLVAGGPDRSREARPPSITKACISPDASTPTGIGPEAGIAVG